jgi:hypothetical protein
MAHPIRPHPERSRHSRRRLAAAPHGEGTHDDCSEIASLTKRIDLKRSRSNAGSRRAGQIMPLRILPPWQHSRRGRGGAMSRDERRDLMR